MSVCGGGFDQRGEGPTEALTAPAGGRTRKARARPRGAGCSCAATRRRTLRRRHEDKRIGLDTQARAVGALVGTRRAPFRRPQCGPGVLGATFPFLPRSFRGYDFRSPGAATQCWHREVERFLWLMCLGCVATAAFADFLWSLAFCGTWAIRPLLASTGVARGAGERTLSLCAGRSVCAVRCVV